MEKLDFRTMPRWMDKSLDIMGFIDDWARVYEVPRDAIICQITIAYVWTKANPKKAPKKDPVRFLHNWMRLAKKMGNLVVQQPDRTFREARPADDEIMTGADFAAMRRAI